jgi:gliding motility-associated-like protein
LTVGTPTTTSPACPGQNTGTIAVSAAGGWSDYAVQWSPLPGVGGMAPTGVAPGSYTATVTDGNGCALVRSAVVATPQANTVTNSTPTNVTCFNQANGSISITLSSTFNSVNWVDGTGAAAGSGTTISGLGGGSYTATVNYGTGCTLQHGPVMVVNPLAVTISPNPVITEDDDIVGGAIDLTATGGTGSLSYSWAGPGGFTATSQDITGLNAGTYTVTVKDANNCSSVQSIVVPSACAVCISTVAVTENACEADGCVVVTVPANAQSPFVLTWNGGTQPVVYPQGVYELELCGLAAGSYNVTVTDANNQFFALPTITVAQRPQVTTTYTSVNPTLNNANGSITVSSGPGLSFEWISGNVAPGLIYSPVLFNLDSGTYVVVVTNNALNGCSKTYTIHLLRQYPVLAPCGDTTITQPPCASSNNGSIELFPQGGDNVFSYQWTSGATTKKLSNLAPGTYTCTVTTGDGQSGVCGPYTLTNISSLAISNVNELSDYNGYQVSGTGICNGSASVVTTGASGTVSYLWSNGVTSANNTTLCGGAYTVVATDQVGCTSAWAGDLTAPTAVNAVYSPATSYNGYGVSCNGKCDGAARVNITGGVLPYLVKWSSGKTELITNTIVFAFENNLCAGVQNVEITDANGLLTNFTFTLTEPDPLSITFTDVEPSSVADCDGEIIPFADGAVGDVTFSWRSQFRTGSGLRADGLCPEEELLFTVTDENGCKATATHIVPFPIDGCFQIVPVVTPNSDGDNDYFKITCIETVENTVEIYDRWNQSAGKYTNYANSWDGTLNGVPVPEGVYFVVVNFTDYQGKPQSLKGYFNVLH